MFYIFQPFFILCSSFYLQTYTDMQSSRVTSLCYISEFLKHILALLGCFDILHLYFVEQLTNISPFACPLVSVNVINHASLSAHVLHIPTLFILCSSFYRFIRTQTFPFTNILHPYLLNTQLIFPQSFSLPLSLSCFFSLHLPLSLSLLLSLQLSIFSSTSTSLFLCLFASRPPSILVSFVSCSSTPSPSRFPSIFVSVSSLGLCISLFSPLLSPPFLSLSLYLSLPLPLSMSVSPLFCFPSLFYLSALLFQSSSFTFPVSPSPSLSFLNKALLQLSMTLFFIELQFSALICFAQFPVKSQACAIPASFRSKILPLSRC